MILRQYYLGCLAHASYLIGDEASGIAAVVDPQRDVQQYLDDAAAAGLAIRYAILTHFHADFLAGHLELREKTGARIVLGARAAAEYDFTPLANGEGIDLGGVRLVALETPGHTPESISILVYDLAKSAETPHAVLTGDTLFVGDVGRPDLRAALGWSAADLGSLLYDSLREKLLALPDGTLVYPAHGAGSMCGKKISRETVSTIGDQRRYNYALQPMPRDAFLRVVLADQPDAPPYFTYDAVLNTKERPTLEAVLGRALKPLTVDEVTRLVAGGAQVLDARAGEYFCATHFAGSINVGLQGEFATWAGTVLDRERPIVLIAEPGREEEAATRLGRIGFDHVAGYLDGGMEALEAHRSLVGWIERVAPATFAEEIAAGAPRLLLDVRTPSEFSARRIAGSVNVPLSRLPAEIAAVPRDRAIVVTCAGGYRSAIAASVLARAGATDVADLAGGVAAWSAAKLPTIES